MGREFVFWITLCKSSLLVVSLSNLTLSNVKKPHYKFQFLGKILLFCNFGGKKEAFSKGSLSLCVKAAEERGEKRVQAVAPCNQTFTYIYHLINYSHLPIYLTTPKFQLLQLQFIWQTIPCCSVTAQPFSCNFWNNNSCVLWWVLFLITITFPLVLMFKVQS